MTATPFAWAEGVSPTQRTAARRAWEALIERIDLSRERVSIILRCEQVHAFLGWPGNGLFKLRPNADGKHHHIFVLQAHAFAVRSERQFRLPLDVGRQVGMPKPGLVDLMEFARVVQGIVLASGSQSKRSPDASHGGQRLSAGLFD